MQSYFLAGLSHSETRELRWLQPYLFLSILMKLQSLTDGRMPGKLRINTHQNVKVINHLKD